MPSRSQTIADALGIIQSTTYPGGFSAQTAWIGTYRALMWYEPVNAAGIVALPHIIDANQLRPVGSKKAPTAPNAWQRRAQAFEQYLAQALGCPSHQAQQQVDQLMRLPGYQGMQRQNPLGIAFPGVAKFIFERFGNQAIAYDLEVDATTIFPGITIPGRSTKPMIDILGRKGNLPVAIISAKWSLRHDRVNDMTNECPAYKSAAMWTRNPLRYYVITNEFAPTRLSRILTDKCIDALAHVHKNAVVGVGGLDGRLVNMLDLADLVSATHSW